MRRAGPFTALDLARALGGAVEGDASALLEDVKGLDEAGPEHLSFLSNRRYVQAAKSSRAGAVLVGPGDDVGPRTVIRCADPYAAFARALTLFHPAQPRTPGVDPRAHVDPTAQVEGATIEAFAWVGPGARVGAGTWVGPSAVVGENAQVGADCTLMAHSVVCDGCVLGDRVWLNPGAVVGGEGFGFAPTAEGNLKIPQVGRAVVEDDVEVGANSCIDRAAMGDTVVRRGAKLDNLVQVGHAAEVGEHSLMVAYSGVAGSSKLGKRVVLAAKAAVLGHIELGDHVQVGVASAVTDDVPAGGRVTGIPAIDHKTWLRAATTFKSLPDLERRLRLLEDPMTTPLSPASDAPAGALDVQKILDLLPHRYPFLLIDRVVEVVPGERCRALKCVTVNEPFFQGHFPGMPIMPGVLIAEAFAQVAGIVALTANPDYAGKAVYLMGLDGLRFRKPVTPGDRLELEVVKTYAKRGVWTFDCTAVVDGKKVADGQVMATVADRP